MAVAPRKMMRRTPLVWVLALSQGIWVRGRMMKGVYGMGKKRGVRLLGQGNQSKSVSGPEMSKKEWGMGQGYERSVGMAQKFGARAGRILTAVSPP